VGIPELEVVHSGAGPRVFVAVQPAGSWGGVTPSKAWLKTVAGFAQEAVGASNTSVLAVEAAPRSPPAARRVVPIAVPPTNERARLRLGALAQLLVAGSYATVVAVGLDESWPPKLQSLPLATALPEAAVGLGMLALGVQLFAAMS
jgi:hypothetical protein